MQTYIHKTPSKSFSWKPNYNLASKFKTQQPISKKIASFSKIQLPIVIKTKGKNYRYLYDGTSTSLELVASPTSLIHHGFTTYFVAALTDFFIPMHVPHNYIHYVKWKFLHRLFSSALQVLATQAMFRAMGVGYAQTLPSAAALNWVLKDGLGRLSRCIYTASVGSAFDTNLKRVRLATSAMFTLSIGVELMTPAFPNCFLLLASLANISKQISLAGYLATGTAIHRSFALADNLGEVSAKGQIQTVCFDNLGLLLAASLNILCRNNQRLQAGLPLLVYPIFSAIDLCGIYQSLKHVHLQTLTKDRLEIILDTWIECGYVPSPAQVSKLEGIHLFNDTGRKKGLWPIRIGCLDPKIQIPHLSFMTLTSLTAKDCYFITLESHGGRSKSQRLGVLLALREGVEIKDIIMGLLQACYIRNAIQSSGDVWTNIFNASDITHSISRQWLALIQNSKLFAEKDQNLLQEQMVNAGWAVKNILLSTREQARYDFVNESI